MRKAAEAMPVAHAGKPSYSEGRDEEDRKFEDSLGKQILRPYLENTQPKKGWEV
jgi:hypothetical protein